jgi:hypothetical protein
MWGEYKKETYSVLNASNNIKVPYIWSFNSNSGYPFVLNFWIPVFWLFMVFLTFFGRLDFEIFFSSDVSSSYMKLLEKLYKIYNTFSLEKLNSWIEN